MTVNESPTPLPVSVIQGFNVTTGSTRSGEPRVGIAFDTTDDSADTAKFATDDAGWLRSMAIQFLQAADTLEGAQATAARNAASVS